MPAALFVPPTEQKTVITHRDGQLQVVACAGAGKTEAISRRMCTLIENGIEPAQIVAFAEQVAERTADDQNPQQPAGTTAPTI
jgi:UvrD/REP helicase N-terminal domain